MTLSVFGLIVALIYIAIAVWVVFTERTGSAGGNWISLNGMASYIITMPVSMPMEMLGARPDYQKIFDMAAAILICATLVYFVGAGLEWVVHQLLGAGPDS